VLPDCDELEIGVLTELGPLLLDSTSDLTPFDASCSVRVTVLSTLTVFQAEAFTEPALSLPVSGTEDLTDSDLSEVLEVLSCVIVFNSKAELVEELSSDDLSSAVICCTSDKTKK
jgi:hypothetical protein